MMQFPRQFRGYIANIQALAGARREPLKFSYFFQLHIFVAFFLALAFTPDITDVVRSAGHKLAQIPRGVTIEKKGADFSVSGVDQPYSLVDGDFVLMVDTVSSTPTRPAQAQVFISKEALEIVVARATQPSADKKEMEVERMLWRDGGDFKFNLDDVRGIVVDHEAAAITVVTIMIFLYFFVSSVVFSTLLISVWSVLAMVMQRFVYHDQMSFRDALALHMAAITGPLVLWGLCIIFGIGPAPLVEVIALVVYSTLGLRFAGVLAPPTGPSQEDVKK